MIDPLTSVESRTALARERAAALRHAARPSASPSPLRRSAGSALVRIGLMLGGAGDSPRHRSAASPMSGEAPARAGASPAR
jgi:hypothetical protein